MSARVRTALLVALAAASAAPEVAAVTVSDTADRRVLGGHTFVPSGTLREPFIVTSLTNKLGVGKATNLRNPLLVIDGETIEALEGELTFVGLDITYQQAVREWLAASVRVGGLGRIGTNTSSLLNQGINAAAGWQMEWLMRLARRERWTLAGVVGLENASGTFVNIVDWVESGADLVRSSNALVGYLGLRGAYAFNPTVGVIGSVVAGYGESFDPGADDKWYTNIEAGLSVDLGAPWSWPLGLALGGRFSSLPSAGDDVGRSQAAVILRFAYTGREDFVVGLDVASQWIPQYSSDELVNAGTTGLGLHYYF